MSNIAKQTQILHWLFAPTKLRKPKIKTPSKENLNDLELQTPNLPPKSVSYNNASKGNLSIKGLTTNLTHLIKASPLPSNDFYK